LILRANLAGMPLLGGAVAAKPLLVRHRILLRRAKSKVGVPLLGKPLDGGLNFRRIDDMRVRAHDAIRENEHEHGFSCHPVRRHSLKLLLAAREWAATRPRSSLMAEHAHRTKLPRHQS
jgi:hypothetical protein